MFFSRRQQPPSWIIVFLGNPGSRFENTRHNVGFMTADSIAKKIGVKINRIKYNSLTAVTVLGGERVLLMKPQTYMNLSGNSARQAMKFYSIPLSNVLVVTDDVALPVGKLRVRRRGSAGGHNGLKDIIAKCGGEDFPRIKIGIGQPPHEDYEMADWVLSKFSGEDAKIIPIAVQEAAQAVETIISQGVEHAMGEYN